MSNSLKYIFFGLILCILCLPAIQLWLNIIEESELDGAYVEEDYPPLNLKTWKEGDFQASFDSWLENNIGFHNSLVRLNNQMNYSLLHKIFAEGVIRGKGGHLYEYDYIRAWEGKDYIGEKILDKKLRKLRFLQEKLKADYDIDLILVLEPGKASIYPENIPDKYVKAEPGLSNYDYVVSRSQELDIRLIDFNAYYKQIKDTSTYPLFPIQGTHWSSFAFWYAADSLVSYIEDIRGIKLPVVVKDSTIISDSLQSTDYDMGVALNLFWELEHGPMPYPVFHFEEDTTIHQKPHVLTIADSYYFNIFNSYLPAKLFANQAFWYFYKTVYPESWGAKKLVEELDLKTEIEKQDVIFLMITERFLYKFDRGFLFDLADIYGPLFMNDEIDEKINNIINLDEFFNSVIKDVVAKNISLGTALERAGSYIIFKDDPERYYGRYGPEMEIRSIRKNKNWYAIIEQQAKDNNIDIEEMLYNAACIELKKTHPAALEKYEGIEKVKKYIRSDSTWYAQIKDKASRYFLTVEEVLQADAEWVYNKDN